MLNRVCAFLLYFLKLTYDWIWFEHCICSLVHIKDLIHRLNRVNLGFLLFLDWLNLIELF